MEPTAEEKAKQREQVRTARSLFAKLLDLRQSQTYNDQALEMTFKALQFHPEFPTLWGYRRELLTRTEKPLEELLKMEMKLVEKALRRSQKVYSIWFHRKWAIERLFQEVEGDEAKAQSLLNTELELCNQLLEVDERNFHCWNHRMYVMDLMRTKGKHDPNQMDLNAIDLTLSTDLINKNFSNYSAWHLRTLLQQPVAGEEPRIKLNLEEELEWVQQGIYTEPNDQSVWLYHQWLTLGSTSPEIIHCAVLQGELYMFFSQACRLTSTSLNGSSGRFEAILPRRRSTARVRSWAVGWRFVTDDRIVQKTVEVEVAVESCGTGILKQSQCTFKGQPIDLDSDTPSTATFEHQLPLEQSEILKAELARIEELLEIEPDCRWALLARMRLQLACSIPEETTLEDFERMSSLDPLRANFYADSKANAVLHRRSYDWSLEGWQHPLNLANLGLKHLAPTAAALIFGVRILKLDENALKDFGPLLGLASLIELSVSRNQIRGDVAEVFALKRLQRIDLSWNFLSVGIRGSPPQTLREIDMSGNPNILDLADALDLLMVDPASWKLQVEAGQCLACRQ